MKLLALTGLLLLLATLLSPAGHRHRHRVARRPLCRRVAPVQIIRSPWVARAPKTVRRVGESVNQ